MNANVAYPNPLSLFNLAYQRGRFQKLVSRFLKCPNILLDLDDITTHSIYSQHYAGLKPVSIDLICGTQGRSKDFDRHFHPLSDRIRDRWVSVAKARQKKIPLDVVRLIRINECYFVVDGHNRISVVRTLGESAVDAEVTQLDRRFRMIGFVLVVKE